MGEKRGSATRGHWWTSGLDSDPSGVGDLHWEVERVVNASRLHQKMEMVITHRRRGSRRPRTEFSLVQVRVVDVTPDPSKTGA